MNVSNLISMLGGLALFLYGMHMMSDGLEAAAGNRMKRILERLTANRLLGVAVGAGITIAIQSSSATTVMAVGFVNSGMMTLRQAVWIIMGANVGTTVTGQLIALDIGALAPLITFCGVVMVVFLKKPHLYHYGQIVAGLGILFIGMGNMSSAMKPLRDSVMFRELVTTFSNPLVGILVGAIFTAVIQSSSASVGILQALAVSGVITLPTAVYVLFGQNIGTCITAIIASIGTSRAAKRTTIIHLLFNTIGTALFTVLCMASPLAYWVQSWTPTNPSAQIANMHTLFNVATTLLLIPFGNQLATLATRLLPERADEQTEEQHLQFLRNTEHSIGSSAIAINGIWQELGRMMNMVRFNVDQSFVAVEQGNTACVAEVEKSEDYVDYLNQEISRYISKIIAYEENETDSAVISAFYKVTGNLERISDHAMNLAGYSQRMKELGLQMGDTVRGEIQSMHELSMQAIGLITPLEGITKSQLQQIANSEQAIDDMTASHRANQLRRMQQGSNDESGVLYSEMLTDFERIGDHILNIGQELAAIGATS